MWASWARTVMPAAPARFAAFAVNVMGIQAGTDDAETASRGIDAMESFFRSIGMPVCISEMGIDLTDEDIQELAYKCTFMGRRTIGRIVSLDQDAIANIYRMART